MPLANVLTQSWERWGTITIVAVSCYLAATRLVWHAVLEPSFAHLEAQEAARDMGRVFDALQREVGNVAAMATDYATWDECHDFASGTSPRFVEKNFAWSHLDRAMDIQIFAILDATGNILASGASPHMREPDRPRCLAALPIALLRERAPAGPPPHSPAAAGIVSLPSAPLIVAAAPIRRNSGEGPAVGHMVLARLLDTDLIAAIAQHAQVSIEMRDCGPSDPPGLPTTSRDTPLLTRVDARTLRAEALVLDIAGKPALRVIASLPRPIMARGRHAMDIINWLTAIATSLIAFLFGSQQLRTRQLEFRTGQLIESRQRLDEENRCRMQELARRHEAEAALRESEKKFRELVESTRDWIFQLDSDGRCTYASPQAEHILGHPIARIIGATPFDLMSPGDAPRARETFLAAAAAREPIVNQRWKLVHRDGQVVTLETSASPVIDESGSLVGYRGVGRDIVRRAAAEAELRRVQERLDAVLKAVPLPLFAKDTDGRYIFFNPAFEAFFGVRGDALIAKTTAECWPSEHALIYHERDLQLLRQGGLQIYEHRLQDASGRDREIIFNKACFADAEGNTAGLVGTLTDVTALKQAEYNRRALERQVQEAQKMESLGLLAGGIAHDFNNLLTGILGRADLAIFRTSPTDPVRTHLQAILTAGQRAADLCRQMLAYAGRGRFVVEHLDINATIHEMIDLLDVSISKHVVIALDLSPDLPLIDADATQIRQVIMNLVTNASEAIGITPGTVRIRTRREEPREDTSARQPGPGASAAGFICVEITDTGCGMTPETIGKIFDPFFTTKFTGRGLGLAAVLGIVRSHGGTVSVDSHPGKGSTFRLILPAVAPPSPTPAPGRDSTAAPAPEPWKGRGTLLLADDEDAVRSVATQMCEHLGFDVLAACDGAAALHLLKKSGDATTCVILDLVMPGMDGIQAFSAIRAMRPNLPVILSSGYSEIEVRRRFGKAGFTAFIQKPYQLAGLQEVLRAALAPADRRV